MSAAASSLVAAVYQAVPDPARWESFVADLGRELRAPAVALVLGFRGNGSAARRFSVGVSDRESRRFEHYLAGAGEPFALEFPPEPRRFRVFRGDQGVGFGKSALYREWMRPRGLLHLVAGRLHGGSDHACGLGLLRGGSEPPFETREVALLSELAPHLEHALDVQEAAGLSRPTGSELTRIVETIQVGVLVVDASGRLLFANCRARRLLSEGDGLVLERPLLGCSSPEETALLRRSVEDAARGKARPGSLLVSRRALGRAPLRVLVEALRPSATFPNHAAGAALLLLVDSEEGGPGAEASLRSLHHLTPAEARVAARIAEGHRPAEIADLLGLRVSTVRTHLQHVLEKTGAHSQAQLVRLLLTRGRGGR